MNGCALVSLPAEKKEEEGLDVKMNKYPQTTDRERELHHQIIALRAENERSKNILAGVEEHVVQSFRDAVGDLLKSYALQKPP